MIKQFLFGVGLILVFFSVSGVFLDRSLDFSPEKIKGMYYSGILATANIVVAFLVIYFTIHRSMKVFMRAFLSGIGIRFLLIVAVIFWILSAGMVDHFVFLVSLFILYAIFQFWEVMLIHRHFKKG